MSLSSAFWLNNNGKRGRTLSFDWRMSKVDVPSFFSSKRCSSESSYFDSIKNEVTNVTASHEEVGFSLLQFRKLLAFKHIDHAEDRTPPLVKDTRLREHDYVSDELYKKCSISHAEEVKILEKVDKLITENKNEPLIASRRADVSVDEKDKLMMSFTSSDSDHTILINKFSVEMTRSKISCLRPRVWLNDEVINFYMLMLMDRDEKLTAAAGGEEKRRTSHYFNSFFIAKMLENDKYAYSNIKRWSKKFDVFAKDKIFMPINIRNTHWTLAVVFVQKKEIHYYDSMSGSGEWYMKNILKWLEDEAREKNGHVLNKDEWKLVDKERHVPQQNNGVDCGVFVTVCSDFLSDDLPLSYCQADMQDYRVKIGCAILRGNITY